MRGYVNYKSRCCRVSLCEGSINGRCGPSLFCFICGIVYKDDYYLLLVIGLLIGWLLHSLHDLRKKLG